VTDLDALKADADIRFIYAHETRDSADDYRDAVHRVYAEYDRIIRELEGDVSLLKSAILTIHNEQQSQAKKFQLRLDNRTGDSLK